MNKISYLSIFIISLFILVSCNFDKSSSDITNDLDLSKYITGDFSFKVLDLEAPPQADIEIKWLIAHHPEKYFLTAANLFKNIVEEKSNGQITVTIITVPEKDLSKNQRVDLRNKALDMIRNGDIHMMQVYTDELAKYNSKLQIFDIPKLFRDYKHVDSVVDGNIGQQLLDGIESPDLKGLAFTFSGGFMTFISINKDIKSLADLNGQRLRGDLSAVNNLTYEQLGLIPFNAYNSEGNRYSTTKYVEYNLVDVLENTLGDIPDILPTDKIKSILNSNHRVLFTALVINKQFFGKLNAEQKQIVQEAAIEAARAERYKIKADIDDIQSKKEYIDLLRELSVEDQKRLLEISTYVQKELEKTIGTNLVSEIRNSN